MEFGAGVAPGVGAVGRTVVAEYSLHGDAAGGEPGNRPAERADGGGRGLDAYSRKVVGRAMADHLRTELVFDAVGMAITPRKPAAGTVHQTDRGLQYTSYEFGKALRASGLLASMGRVGSAFDAPAEAFKSSLRPNSSATRAPGRASTTSRSPSPSTSTVLTTDARTARSA